MFFKAFVENKFKKKSLANIYLNTVIKQDEKILHMKKLPEERFKSFSLFSEASLSNNIYSHNSNNNKVIMIS